METWVIKPYLFTILNIKIMSKTIKITPESEAPQIDVEKVADEMVEDFVKILSDTVSEYTKKYPIEVMRVFVSKILDRLKKESAQLDDSCQNLIN